MAGAGGLEPTNAGSKNRCLATWLRPNKTLFLQETNRKQLLTHLSMLHGNIAAR